MPFNTQKRKPLPKGKVADLAEEDRKRIELYQIYGNQNPSVKTRRGRVFD
jgi:hypothetical protein